MRHATFTGWIGIPARENFKTSSSASNFYLNIDFVLSVILITFLKKKMFSHSKSMPKWLELKYSPLSPVGQDLQPSLQTGDS